MQNIRNLPQRSKVSIISLILVIFCCLELIFRIYKCYLGEFVSLFWINFALLTFLFYWPTYFSANQAISQTVSVQEEYRIFLTALLRAIFFLIIYAIGLVLMLAVWKIGISDTLLFWPLLFFWVIYTVIQVKQNFPKIIIPFSLTIITTILVLLTVPANPTLATFDRHLQSFEEVVAMVKSGEIKTPPGQAVSEVLLPCDYRHLVGCPNRKISITKEGYINTIFFCSDLGVWGNRKTGFIYRSDRKDISVKPSGNYPYLEVRKLKNHWFWKVED
ncbi:hypothetical protein ACE1CD_14180 [Aerosakkonema sp. BLCC-F183]